MACPLQISTGPWLLHWSSQASGLASNLSSFYQNNQLVDVTLCAEKKKIKAHAAVLAASSQFFKKLLMENSNNNDDHHLFIIPDVPYADLKACIDMIYYGKIFLDKNQLTSFLKTAKMLGLNELTLDVESLLKTKSNGLKPVAASAASSSAISTIPNLEVPAPGQVVSTCSATDLIVYSEPGHEFEGLLVN